MEKLTLQEYLDQTEEYYQDDDCNPVAEYVGSLGYGDADLDAILDRFVAELAGNSEDRLHALIDYFKESLSTEKIVSVLIESAKLESGDWRHYDNTLYSRSCGEIEVGYNETLYYVDCSEIWWRLVVDLDEAVARFEFLLPPLIENLVNAYKDEF